MKKGIITIITLLLILLSAFINGSTDLEDAYFNLSVEQNYSKSGICQPQNFSYLFKDYHFNSTVTHAIDDNWWYYICDDINEHFAQSVDQKGFNVTVSNGWEYQDGYFLNSECDAKISCSDIHFGMIYCVPKGTFGEQYIDLSKLAANSRTSIRESRWINTKILYLELFDESSNTTEIRFLMLLEELSDDDYEYLVFPNVKSDITQEALSLFDSMRVTETLLKLSENSGVMVYKYDEIGILFVSMDGNGWLYDKIESQYGFNVSISMLDDMLFNITVYDVPNVYSISINPLTCTIMDSHRSESELATISNIADYRSFYSMQYENGIAEVYFMTSDNLVYFMFDENGNVIKSREEQFKFDSELSEDIRHEMYDEVIKALCFQNGETKAQHCGFALGRSLYFTVERSAMYKYDDFCYYLSCLFTEESTDKILNSTDIFGNPTYIRGDDGLLYISLYIDNDMPVYDEFKVIYNNNHWRCVWNYMGKHTNMQACPCSY